MKIYLATSWSRCDYIDQVLVALRDQGHEVYDFRDGWVSRPRVALPWRTTRVIHEIRTEARFYAYHRDLDAIQDCDLLIMLIPAGNSAHVELGLAAGLGKRVAILAMHPHLLSPDTLYNVTQDGHIVTSMDDLSRIVQEIATDLAEGVE